MEGRSIGHRQRGSRDFVRRDVPRRSAGIARGDQTRLRLFEPVVKRRTRVVVRAAADPARRDLVALGRRQEFMSLYHREAATRSRSGLLFRQKGRLPSGAEQPLRLHVDDTVSRRQAEAAAPTGMYLVCRPAPAPTSAISPRRQVPVPATSDERDALPDASIDGDRLLTGARHAGRSSGRSPRLDQVEGSGRGIRIVRHQPRLDRDDRPRPH